MDKILKIAKERQKELFKLPNVVMVGVGPKIKDGKDTGELAIVVGVTKKIPTTELWSKAIVPATIKGQKTDVQEVGIIRALQEQTARVRPAIPGYSVGHFRITAGTIGLKVYDNNTGEPLLLSNNHVLANVDTAKVGDAILQPGPADGGTVANDMIATLLRWVNISTAASSCVFTRLWSRLSPKAAVYKVDCALARLVSPDILIDEIAGTSRPLGVMEAVVNMPCQKWGRTTGLTKGTVIAIGVTVQVDYGEFGTKTFEDQIAVSALSQGGDSGSAILSDLDVIGLLFAGSDTITIGNRIQNVFDELGVSLAAPAPPAPAEVLVKVSLNGGQTWQEFAPAPA